MQAMPELPEVETVVRGLAPVLLGRRIDRFQPLRPDLRWPLPPDLAQRMTGATVTAIARRAKFGLVATDRCDTLLFHLGMSGRFRPLDGPPGRHDHVWIEAGGTGLAFHDPRRFGAMDIAPTAALAAHPWLEPLGPEPLGPDFTARHLAAAFAGRGTPVKTLLMDQRVVAGIGNIYASEALHAAGIDPARAAGRIAPARLVRLVDAVRAVLERAIAAGGSSLRDHAQVSGESGYFQHQFLVYGRAGQPCPACATPIRRRVHAARSTFDCPRCQR